MRIRIVAVGQRMPRWVDDAFEDYRRRFAKPYAVELVELKAAIRGEARDVDKLLNDEAQRIVSATQGFHAVALDERGVAWTTQKLAERLTRWRDEAQDAAFVIGSADGLHPSVKRSAADVVSLSAMTLPHALVRVVLIEQLYRAVSVAMGHPYHRE
ncbi:MAG TPA: 23S rRNA (pseudouridine(1915)-N(3))-methyltransferase RlmH [Casimicrobiaceae bacterium]|nr:23S rRNA (pseudouridine(1915)-N(3))-methyltransferase RlmH [Casimicrobiaceae bacterium]